MHATHLVDEEVRALAGSGATVALCPTTEANLGDGLFPLRAFLDAGALPTLHDRYGISRQALAARIKGWLG